MKQTIEKAIGALNRIDLFVCRVEGWIMVLIMIAMLFVGIVQILARQLSDLGLHSANTLINFWSFSDPFLRQMMLWVGLLGAAIAAQENRNISIDAVTRLLPNLGKLIVRLLIGLLVFYISFIFFKACLGYWELKRNQPSQSEILFGIPFWRYHIIYPIAFIMIIFHQGIKFLIDLLGLCVHKYDLIIRSDEMPDAPSDPHEMPASSSQA